MVPRDRHGRPGHRTRHLSSWLVAGLATCFLAAPAWMAGTRAGATGAAALPSLSPVPSIAVLSSPSPDQSPSPSSGSGGSDGSSGGSSSSQSSGTGNTTTTGGAGQAVGKAINGATRGAKAGSGGPAEETSGCGTYSAALITQLSREEPPPPFVLAEPPGMEGPETTARLMPALRRAHVRAHIPVRTAFLKAAGPFPVAGPASWSNDWHAFRPCPYPHLHQGLDIFAREGTPVVAVTKSLVYAKGISSMSGLYVEITNAHGMRFFYCHLSGFAKNLRVGQRVREGQILGYVGNTGDARGGPTHLHLQVEPGGVPVPPKPFVDRWLLSALRQARTLEGTVSSGSTSHPGPRLHPLIEDVLAGSAPRGAGNGPVTQETRGQTTARVAGIRRTSLVVPGSGLGILVLMALVAWAARRSPAEIRPRR